MEFPSLTGTKAPINHRKRIVRVLHSQLSVTDVRNATASVDALPVSLLQAAWSVVLSMYVGAHDNVIFGTFIRTHNGDPKSQFKDEDHLISTEAPLFASGSWNTATIGDVLAHLAKSNDCAVQSKQHQDVEAIAFKGLSKNATLVAFHDAECCDHEEQLYSGTSADDFVALGIEVFPAPNGLLTLRASYAENVLDEGSALVVLAQLEDLLCYMTTNLAKPIQSSCQTAIRPLLLSIYNQDVPEINGFYAEAPLLQSQFEITARENPDLPALEFWYDLNAEQPTRWTYGELNAKADVFARYLKCHFGQLSDKPIPICMDRCPELYVAILGILKAGGGWCPVDASFPARRRHDLIVRTGSQILIVADQHLANDPDDIPQGVASIDITTIDPAAVQQVDLFDVQMGTLAYLIWTSGTTGAPKGVPIHHDAALTSMRALQRSIPTDVTGDTVRCMQFSHFTFDVFVQDLFYTWGVKGSIISATRSIMLGSFAQLANKAHATHAHLTPAFAASVPRHRCTSLEVVTMIGEKLTQAVADDWGHDIRAYNTYGPAETTVVSTYRQFGGADDEIRSENVGYPLPSVSALVMRDGLPLMRHGVGELALGGPQLSKGYWNDPEKTAGRFIWSEGFSRTLYMTGDMVRQLHDGSFVFVGREDDLIKIQGIRVELSEISFGLRACHRLVEQVETQYLDRHDRPSKVIVAFLAAPTLADVDSELIAMEKAAPIARQALLEAQKALPDYMIPRVFLVVGDIPKTPSNKIDRNRLKEVYSSTDLGAWERALATQNDSTIGDVGDDREWSQKHMNIITSVAELSGTSSASISRHSDLRSIGIDSIAATRLAPMLNSKGFSISVADILQCQNPDDIVKMLGAEVSQRECYDLTAFHNGWYSRVGEHLRRDDFVVLPSLPLQESLISESMQNAKAYWSSTLLFLDPQVDLIRLKSAWAQIVNCTDALRTGFVPSAVVADEDDSKETTFLQVIYNKAGLDWTILLESDGDSKDFAAQQAHRVAERFQKKAFVDPPIAITVFERATERIMMISIHHSIRDEPSLDFVLDDVWTIYNNGRPKERHQSQEAMRLLCPTTAQNQQSEKHWTEVLADYATVDDANTFPDLSGDQTKEDEKFITHNQTLSTGYKTLQSAAIQLGATSAASILRVAWGCLLLAYLEAGSTVFAETWSDRTNDPSLADIVGPLTSVLPVPFRAEGSAREAMVAQSRMQKKSRSNRSVHGRAVRRLLKRPDHQSVYSALFNFLPVAGEDAGSEWSHLWRKLVNVVALTVEHPLALNVTPTASGSVEIELVASSRVMDATHLAVLGQQVDAMVQVMLKEPDTPLQSLPAHFPANLISKTSVVFSEEVKHASTQDPLSWVDHYANVQPLWPAAMFFNAIEESEYECWNYAELQSAYKRVATFLRSQGFRHRMIAVCLDRRLEAYAVVLGILASGNTYLPIDEGLPDERKSFLIQDSQAVMLFTTSGLAAPFTNTDTRLIHVDSDTYMDVMFKCTPIEPSTVPDSNENAYLLYTSGSTGVPKGVLVGRGNLCSFIEGLSEYIQPRIPGMNDLPGKGRYLGLASRAFDVHLAEMFLAWRRGMAAVTAPRTLLLDNLDTALRTFRITHASFVPSLIDQAGLDPANLPDLHYLGVGGEKMSKRTVDTWAASKNAALVNAYGPTEMSIGCTAAEVTSKSKLRNIGKPYGNSVAHVLVPGSNEHTLRGVAGELCFTGDLVANGYHNRPDAEGFVEDFHGKRMYRTGDIVRLMADDTLEYLRREDDQTKVRGQRLELGEITEAIRSSVATTLTSDKIDAATIVAQHPKLPRPQLVNFVVTQRDKSDSTEILRTPKDREMASNILDHCQKILPSYMVPDVVLPLSKLPLAPASGKADQKRLKALFADASIENLFNRSNETESRQRELTRVEKAVRGAVKSTLNVDDADIYPDTNIFRLGLESLSAINLVIRMQKLGFECSVSTVLKNPTVKQLALLPQKEETAVEHTSSHMSTLRARYLESHPRGSTRIVKPCLPLQETLVASSLSDPSRALYVNNVVLKLSATIDTTRLSKAITQVVADHDILRTSFQEFESGFVQVIHQTTSTPPWEEVIVTDLDIAVDEMRNAPCMDIIRQIGEIPPLRLTLLRQNDSEQNTVLLIQIHHALYDGESFAMVLEDIDRRYRSVDVPLRTPFDSLLEYVGSQDRDEAEKFWKHYLSDFESSYTMAHDATSGSSTTDRVLTSSISQLEEFSATISGTLTSTVQSIFGIALAQAFGTHDVMFGAVLSGRTVPIENPDTIVAPCLTTIPQRVNLGTNESDIIDIMNVAKEGFVESLTYQHIALRHIHRWLKADKPLFDCLVTHVQKKARFISDLWTELEGSMTNDFPLAVEFEADYESGQMRVHCAFTSAFGDASKATALLENIDLLLGALVRGENVTTQDLGIVQDPSLRSSPQIWDESVWNSTEAKMRNVAANTSGISTRDICKGSSFFSLGIDSITAIRFAQQLRQSNIECSSADVMRHTCIGALAEHVGAFNKQIDGVEPEEIKMQDLISKIPLLGQGDVVTDAYPCTPLQSSMLTQTLGTDGRLYAHHHALRLTDTIDVPTLKQAWEHLVAQTEILRTTFHFVATNTSWVAAVHKGCSSAWGEADSMNSITQDFAFCNEASFERPPWKTTILRSPGEIVLVISMHHSLYDGISINLLLQDLACLYNGFELHPRPYFSAAAKAISQSTSNAEDFWLRQLHGYQSSLSLSESDETGITNMEHNLTLDLANALSACKALGVTMQTVALLTYAKSLALLSGQRDIVFGHVVGGRSVAIADADEIVGPLFNTVPSRITMDKTFVSNEAMARSIQQFSGDAQARQHASLSTIQQAWRRKAASADVQLFDAVFVFVNNTSSDLTIESLGSPIDVDGAVDPTEYSLNVEVEQGKDNVILRVNARMSQEKLQDWVKTFEETFQDIFERPSRSVLGFPPSLQSLPLQTKSNTIAAAVGPELDSGPDLDAIHEALSAVSQIPAKEISPQISIFALGLDSIAAIQVAAACRKKGYGISVADVLQGRSLSGICRRLRERSHTTPDQHIKNVTTLITSDMRAKVMALLGLEDAQVEQILPCLAGQVFHLASWLKSDRVTCEVVFTYQSSTRLDAEKLKSAWRKLQQRHSILRTAFVTSSPTDVLQVILRSSALNDDSFTSTDSQVPIYDLIQQQAKDHFTLFTPPAKLQHVRSDTQDLVMLKLHHATYDAWTIPALISDLAALSQNRDLPRTQAFKPFVTHTLNTLRTPAQKSYWRNSLLHSQPTLLVPSPTTTNPTSTTSIFLTFPSALPSLSALIQKCQSTSLSLPSLILTAFARTLARHTSTTNPLFGLYQTGRSDSYDGIEDLCAPCLNITPVCVPSVLQRTITESAQKLQMDLAERVPYEQSFLAEVLEFAGLGVEEPVFNTFVNILNTPPTNVGSKSPQFEAEAEEKGGLFTPFELSESEVASLHSAPADLRSTPTPMPTPTPTQASDTPTRTKTKTPIDIIEIGYLSSKNFYLDIVRREDKNCIDLAVKCEGGMMDEGAIRAFVKEMVGDVEAFVGGDAGAVVDSKVVDSKDANQQGEKAEKADIEMANGETLKPEKVNAKISDGPVTERPKRG
ncbi:MAG: hypothetical protein Q9169_004116 [Polycauliona sp. 2 TL-2023]